MADLNKFEEMLEKLVSEDRAGAEELFHEIVVEKSREIYEGLLESDLEEDEEVEETTDEEVDEATDEEVDEATDEDDDDETNEGFDLDEFEVEPIEADSADDFIDDVMDKGDDEEGDMDMDDDAEADGDMEDRLVDLEQELDKLRSEFEAEMGDGDDEGDMDMDDEGDDEEEADEGFELGFGEATDEEVDEAADEEVEEATDEEVEEGEKSEAEQMREYVEKVSATMGDNGANTKSPVAGKNDMGGTASNLVAGGEADTKGTAGGLANPSEKEDNMGNINVPGGKASKSMKNQPKGHGAEKKGAGENADNKKSTIGS